MGFYGVFGKIQRHLSAYTKGAALLPLRVPKHLSQGDKNEQTA